MKVHLKPIERKDLEWLLAYRNDTTLNINFNQCYPLTMDDQIYWYETKVLPRKTFAYLIYLDNLKIGYIALQNINWISQMAEVSHFITPEYEQKTFGYYAHDVILNTAFGVLGLNRVYTACFLFNDFFNELEKLGFKKEGLMRQSCFRFGKRYDSLLMAVLKDEYKSISQ